MRTERFPFPLEAITVGLENDRPGSATLNDDVAFVLTTRFNLRMKIRNEHRWSHLDGRNLKESADYEAFWLRRREFLERVCIPSVLNLSPRPDAWFISFGEMESWFVRDLLGRLRLYPWIKPHLRKPGDPAEAGPLPGLLADYVRSIGKPFLCSTRFDSDDSLHAQFVGALDRAITQLREWQFPDEQRCLNFTYGLMQSGGELSVHLRRSNMFESVFEPVDQIGGPYLGGHDDIRDKMPLVEIVTNLPMWIYHRHENTLEPGWVTARERLPLGDPSRYYPLFGLDPDLATVLRVDSSGDEAARAGAGNPQSLAARLRQAAYWNGSQVAAAIELATGQGQSLLAGWLASEPREEVDPTLVLHAYDTSPLPFLNAAHLARLARELKERGAIVEALRAYDAAVFLTPSDRHLRAERDALAGALAFELDLDEQMELATVAKPTAERSNVVILICSMPTSESEPAAMDQVRERAEQLVRAGFAPLVAVAPILAESGPGAPRSLGLPQAIEIALLSPPGQSGFDAMHRELARQLVALAARRGPCLLVADETPLAQRLAAMAGRALAVPVEFTASPSPNPAVA